jgi:hypothetical protein
MTVPECLCTRQATNRPSRRRDLARNDEVRANRGKRRDNTPPKLQNCNPLGHGTRDHAVHTAATCPSKLQTDQLQPIEIP